MPVPVSSHFTVNQAAAVVTDRLAHLHSTVQGVRVSLVPAGWQAVVQVRETVHAARAESKEGFVLLSLLPAACLLALWLGGGGRANGSRGRLRQYGWFAALAAVAAMVTATIHPVFVQHNLSWWWLIVPLSAAGLMVLRPRLVPAVVPPSLILLGLYGIGLARLVSVTSYVSFWRGVHYGSFWYGLTPVRDQVSGASVVLAQAYSFLLLGGWLAWRELSSHPAAASLLLGRMVGKDRPARPWGLLLLPVTVALAALVSSSAWLVVMIALLAFSMLCIRRSPSLAGRLATAGLIALGLVGYPLVKDWFGYGVPFALPSSAYLRYGAVDVWNSPMANLAAAEALVLLGFGCWLVPRTFPEVSRLLGRASNADLVRRVQRLTESRAVAVDTAAADLRRLERNLHDGAQARLVALGMNLRAAERVVHTSPDAAAALIAEARETSAKALTDLRELVRGVHPPVLADRGLADAVRALVLDSPLTVETEVDLPGRLPAPVETACYFAIAEVLTNAVKHSSARDARIAITHSAGVLRIEITDFGLGGADPGRGTGLAGVERRLATFDGILAVSSPAGGPTMVVMELPCQLTGPRFPSY